MEKKGKTALITGSGQNIGRGIAHELAGSGFNIIVNGSANRDATEAVADEIREYDVEALVAMGNVGKKEDVEAIITAAFKKFDTIDVLINNAAVRPHAPF